MSQTVLSTDWEFYDAKRHAGQGGNYILLLKAFANAPYYVGKATDFANRFAENGKSHKVSFAGALKTFMRRPFIDECTDRSHRGFAARWHHYKQQNEDERKRLVWIPTGSYDEPMGRDGKTVWENEVALLISPNGEDRHSVERRVQDDVMKYYGGLLGRTIDWNVSDASWLFGNRPSGVTNPPLTYRLNGGQAGDAGAFFGSLETARF